MTTGTAVARGGVQTPERSLQQRRDALKRANEIRSLRAATKVKLKFGQMDVRAVILSEDPSFETWQVFDLLLALPSVGRVKANSVLRRHGISPSKTVGGLTLRQRGELLEAVRPWARGVRRADESLLLP
jgi:hypothetical protein